MPNPIYIPSPGIVPPVDSITIEVDNRTSPPRASLKLNRDLPIPYITSVLATMIAQLQADLQARLQARPNPPINPQENPTGGNNATS